MLNVIAKDRMMRSPQIRVSSFLAKTCLMLCVGCGGELVTVRASAIESHVVARGVVEFRQGISDLAVARQGRVTRVLVVPGDHVTAGAPLLEYEGEFQLEVDVIRSPFDAVVVALHADVGDDVSPGCGPIAQVASDAEVSVRFELEPEDATSVAMGAPLRVTSPGGQEIFLERASISRLAPVMSPRSLGNGDGGGPHLGLVRTGWANVDATPRLVVGSEVEVAIARPVRNVRSSVPRSAIGVVNGTTFVRVPGWLSDVDRPVSLGVADRDTVEVRGIAPGTRVRRFANL